VTHRRLLPTAFLFASAAWVGAPAAAQTAWSNLSPETQIMLALKASPAEMREGAVVQGYDASGAFVVLREGSNDLICMAPNPERENFEVSCHHAGLEAFFARGRELSAEGATGQERTQRRWEEFTAGTLPIPYGAVNYILSGSGFDAETGDITDAYIRWTIYTPNATSETTGISTTPAPGAPWLMFPGTPGSHIMITPPRSEG
jgi:hypothetical protein